MEHNELPSNELLDELGLVAWTSTDGNGIDICRDGNCGEAIVTGPNVRSALLNLAIKIREAATQRVGEIPYPDKLTLTVERDEHGDFIVADADPFRVYGTGDTPTKALADYGECLLLTFVDLQRSALPDKDVMDEYRRLLGWGEEVLAN